MEIFWGSNSYSFRGRLALSTLVLGVLIFLNVATVNLGWADAPRFRANDLISGRTSELVWSRPQLGTVLVFLSARCPCSMSHEPAIKELYSQFATQGFDFYAVHSNQDEPLALTQPHFKSAGFPFPVLEDLHSEMANYFKALKTPHAYVVDRQGVIVYQGGVDDSQDASKAQVLYLKNTLQSLVAGKPPELKLTRTLGCVIRR